MKTKKKVFRIVLVCLCFLCVSAIVFAVSAVRSGEGKAKEIALSQVGISEEEAKSLSCEVDFENGVAVYEVEFFYGITRYSYDINILTGNIVKFEIDQSNMGSPSTFFRNHISEENAKKVALSHAGFDESEVKFEKVELESDDGVFGYEIEFSKGIFEYEYTIDALTGKILSFEKDID